MSVTSAQSGYPDDDLPPVVTFQSGASLLMKLGIVEKITHQGIRHIARTNPAWPFGEGRDHPYWDIANVTCMETDPFLSFFRTDYRTGNKAAS